MKKLFSFLLIVVLIACSKDVEEPVLFTLTATANPTEGGTVSPTNGQYESGDVATVTATPNAEYVFEKWTGGATETSSSVSVTMNGNKSVVANFIKKQYPLTIEIEGEGTVTETVIKQGLATDYNSGTIVELTATAETGWEFKEWSGDLTGTDNPSQITIGAAKTIKAVFVKKQFTVNITIEGEGTVTSEVVTGLKVDNKYEYGTDLKLTATAKDDWEFVEWSGDIISTENPVQITIDGSKNVKVKFFNENYFELTYGGEQGEPFEDYNNVVDGPDQNGFLVQSFSEGKSSSVSCDLCVENELHNIVAYSTDELKNQFADIDWKDVSVLDGNKLISFYADGRNNDDSNYPGVGGGPSDGSYSKRVELADNRTEGKFTNGDERYYTLSFWAPSDIWDNSTKWSVVMSQFKQFGGGQPNFEVRLSQEGDYVLTVRAKYNDIPYTDITTVKPDQWNHLKYYIKHSNDSDGKIIIWFNGEKVFEHDGRTLYYNGKDGYFKFGMYTEMRDERILLFDRIKISDGLNGKTIDEWSKDQN